MIYEMKLKGREAKPPISALTERKYQKLCNYLDCPYHISDISLELKKMKEIKEERLNIRILEQRIKKKFMNVTWSFGNLDKWFEKRPLAEIMNKWKVRMDKYWADQKLMDVEMAESDKTAD